MLLTLIACTALHCTALLYSVRADSRVVYIKNLLEGNELVSAQTKKYSIAFISQTLRPLVAVINYLKNIIRNVDEH